MRPKKRKQSVLQRATNLVWRKAEKRYRKNGLITSHSDENPFTSVKLSGDYTQSDMTMKLLEAFNRAPQLGTGLPDWVRDIDGMSGQSYRSLINIFFEFIAPARYLEIGSWKGSTLSAAVCGNAATALCIDNWSQFGGPREQFLENVGKLRNDGAHIEVIEDDFENVNFGEIGNYNVYLFDGPHDERAQYKGIVMAQPALDPEYLLIVDDWNWQSVRTGTLRGLAATHPQVEFSIEIRTTENNLLPNRRGKHSRWHNGYFLGVIKKNETGPIRPAGGSGLL